VGIKMLKKPKKPADGSETPSKAEGKKRPLPKPAQGAKKTDIVATIMGLV